MIWSLLTITSLIRLTRGGPSFQRDLLKGKTVEFGETASSAENNALRLSGYEPRQEHESHGLIPELDRIHVTRLFEPSKNGPYFWKNELFKSNVHVGWKAIDKMKVERSQLSIVDKVQIIQEECAVLRTYLGSHQGLRLITGFYNDQDAYQTLNNFLWRISSLVSEKQESTGISRKNELPYETWDSLLLDARKIIDEMEYILRNFGVQYHSLRTEISHTLMTDVVSIYNFLFKNNLIPENIVEEKLKKRSIQKLLLNDIIGMLDTESFLGLDFHECLLKSKSFEHYSFLFKFLEGNFFRTVEYRFLTIKLGISLQSSHRLPNQISSLASKFRKYIFEKDYRKYMQVEEIIRELIDSFENSIFDPAGSSIPLTIGIVYDMVCFAMKHHSELFDEILNNEKDAQSFSFKIGILDSAVRCLKSAKELSFIGEHGFWTSELSFMRSEHQIPLEQVRYWKPVTNEEVEFFMKNFGCFNKNDFDDWKWVSQMFSFERGKSKINLPESVSEKIKSNRPSGRLLDYFGTNFKLKTPNEEEFSEYQRNLEYEPKISRLFLDDLFSWIERIQILVRMNRRNQDIWNEIVGRISSGKENNITEQLKIWTENSRFISYVIGETRTHMREAELSWEKIKKNMESLNQCIVSLTPIAQTKFPHNDPAGENKILEEMNNLRCESQNKYQASSSTSCHFEVKEGLIIPTIQFGEYSNLKEIWF